MRDGATKSNQYCEIFFRCFRRSGCILKSSIGLFRSIASLSEGKLSADSQLACLRPTPGRQNFRGRYDVKFPCTAQCCDCVVSSYSGASSLSEEKL